MRISWNVVVVALMACSVARAQSAVIEKIMKEQDGRIPREAMVTAFEFYARNADQIANKKFVTIVDYNLPSTQKRMHVINMQSGEVEDLYVAHGKYSGNNYASDFSNKEGTGKSSLGIYLTGEEYTGKHGLSLRLDGMEKGVNDNIRKRDIVLHGATYVSAETAKKQGRMGKSLGCLAVEQPLSARLVKQLEG